VTSLTGDMFISYDR